MEVPARHQEPSSPLDRVPVPRLRSPEPSSTPELTSRSLHRVPDGGQTRGLDFYKCYGLVLDDDEDDWRKTRWTETRDCYSPQESDRIEKLMQGNSELEKWSLSASNMELKKKENHALLEEMIYPWVSQRQNLSTEDAHVITFINREGSQQLHSRVQSENKGSKCVDGYKSNGESTIDNAGCKIDHLADYHHSLGTIPKQVGEAGERFPICEAGDRFSLGEAEEPLKIDISTVFLAVNDDAPDNISEHEGSLRGSQHNQEQFRGRTLAQLQLTNHVQVREKPDISPVSSLFGEEALHKLLGKDDGASACGGVQEKEECQSAGLETERLMSGNVGIIVDLMQSSEQEVHLGKYKPEALAVNSCIVNADKPNNSSLQICENAKVSTKRMFCTRSVEVPTNGQECGRVNMASQEDKSDALPAFMDSDSSKAFARQTGRISVYPVSSRSRKDDSSDQISFESILNIKNEKAVQIIPKTESNFSLSRDSHEEVAYDKEAIVRQQSDSNTTQSSPEPQDGQSKKTEDTQIPARTAAKGRNNEERGNCVLEHVEKAADMQRNHAADGVARSSTSSDLQSPFADRLSVLQKQVEELKEKVAYEYQQKQTLAQRFAEQRHEFERISQTERELWEAKLRELQKDKYALQIRLQALEVENPRQRIKRTGETVNLTEEEIRILRQEITEQETLIQGYQTENEKAVQKLKDLDTNYKERVRLMGEENARLASQLANMQFATRPTIYGTNPDVSKEIQALRVDLHALQTREASLKLALEKERVANKEFEKCLAVLTKEKEEQEETLRSKLSEEQREHSKAIDIKEQQSKLDLNSQELMSSLQSTIDNQAAIITDLRSKLGVVEGEEDFEKENGNHCRMQSQYQKTWNTNQKAKAMKQIEVLQKQVKKLEAALDLRKDLVMGTQRIKPHSDAKDAKIKRLQDEVAALQHQLTEDDATRALQSLRQEHKQLKHEYIMRVRALTQQLKRDKATVESDPSSAKKDKYVDKQVEDVRMFYTKKVKELTHQLEDARKGSSRNLSNLEQQKGLNKLLKKVKDNQATGDAGKVEDILLSRDAIIKKLQQKIKELEARKGGVMATPSSAEVVALRKQLEAAEIAREIMQKTCTEAMERAAMMSIQHQQTISNLKEVHAMRVADVEHCRKADSPSVSHSETDCQRCKNDALENAQGVEPRIKTQLELGEACACPNSPRMAQLEMLKKKVEDMEAQQRLKELEWQRLPQETKKLCGLGLNQEEQERNWQEAMAARNLEIENFRSEVDSIMEAALAFQKSQLQELQAKRRTQDESRR